MTRSISWQVRIRAGHSIWSPALAETLSHLDHEGMPFIETIAETNATGKLAELFSRSGNPDGTVDNVMKIHGLNPGSLRTHFEMYVDAMHRPSPLSRMERELAGTVVSRLNGCEYCLHHHLSGLKRLLPAERHHVADAVATGRVTRLSDRESALIAYATKLTMNPHDMHHDDVERLRQTGLDDRAILDLAQVVAYFNYANRIVKGLGVELESGEFSVGQWPEQAAK